MELQTLLNTYRICNVLGKPLGTSDKRLSSHVAFNCKFCSYYQFLTRAQWLTLAQHNLRNAYRAADQQYRSRSRRNKQA
jgi:hypothetical protein